MGVIGRKLFEIAVKQGKKVQEINAANPLVQDTGAFIVDIAKEIIKPF